MSTASKQLIADLGLFVRSTPFTSSAALAVGAGNCAANLQAGLAGRRALSLRLAKNVASQLGLVVRDDSGGDPGSCSQNIALLPGAVLQLRVKGEDFNQLLELIPRISAGQQGSWYYLFAKGQEQSVAQALLLKLNSNYIVVRFDDLAGQLEDLELIRMELTMQQYLQVTSANAPASLIESWFGTQTAPSLSAVAQLLQCMETNGLTPAALMCTINSKSAPLKLAA